MAQGIGLTVFKNGDGKGKEVSQLVQEVRWSGRKDSPTRNIQVKFIDDDGFNHARSGIDIEEGWQGIFSWNGEELFRGIFMAQTQTEEKTGTFKAYDNGIYLSNNRDTFCYEAKRANEIFSDICTRFGIPTGEIAVCEYEIPDLTKPRTTAWDAIADALSMEYENTNTRYYVSSSKGLLSLRRRKENILQWVLEVGANISRYNYTRSIETVSTRIKLLSKEGVVLAEATDPDMEKKIGILQDVDTPDESLNSAQLTALAKSLLEEKRTPTRTLRLSDTLGLPDVISGVGVFIVIPHLGLNRTFYVDADDHIFTGNHHSMSLQLTYAADVKDNIQVNTYATDAAEETPSSGGGTGGGGGGNYVTFHGGAQYAGPYLTSAFGGNKRGGKARITATSPGTPHPYHLEGGMFNDLGGDCNVYGWVDEGTFS